MRGAGRFIVDPVAVGVVIRIAGHLGLEDFPLALLVTWTLVDSRLVGRVLQAVEEVVPQAAVEEIAV